MAVREGTFDVHFKSEEDNVKGTAEVVVFREKNEIVYLARNIRFQNTNEELLESQLVVEPELRIKAVKDRFTDALYWIDADTDEESALGSLIGAAIEEHDM